MYDARAGDLAASGHAAGNGGRRAAGHGGGARRVTAGGAVGDGEGRAVDPRRYALEAAALVAQWIEHAPPKRGMQVRFLPGASVPCQERGPGKKVHTAPRATVRPLRGREHVRSTDDPGGGCGGAGVPARAGALDAARIRVRAPRGSDRRRALGDLGGARAVGADATQLRRLRLDGVGLPDPASFARPRRGPVVEAGAVPVHGPVCAVRALPAVAVDAHRMRGRAGRPGVRSSNRVPVVRG